MKYAYDRHVYRESELRDLLSKALYDHLSIALKWFDEWLKATYTSSEVFHIMVAATEPRAVLEDRFLKACLVKFPEEPALGEKLEIRKIDEG